MASTVEKAVDVLGVAGSITTLISLAALSLLIGYLVARQWLSSQRGIARDAIAKSDNEALARVLGGTRVPLDDLTADQKYSLATEELRTRSRHRILSYSLVFFAFLALLGLVISLVIFNSKDTNDDKPVQLGLLSALDVLRFVPANGRMAACEKLLSEHECKQGAELIHSLQYVEPTPAQAEIVRDSVSEGELTRADLQELAACEGNLNFQIRNYRLGCANGLEVPYVGTDIVRRPLEEHVAIVFHSTATPEGSYAGVAQFLAKGRPDLPGPVAHILISRTGAVVQSAPFNARANHVGRAKPWNGLSIGNTNSIGIELINEWPVSQQSFTAAQLVAAEGIARALVRAYGIRTIVGHSDLAPNRKSDPGPLFPLDQIRQAAGLRS